MRSTTNWRIFLSLLGLSVLSVFAVFPYILSLQSEVFKQVGQPLPLIFLLQLIQSSILFTVAIFFGLRLTKETDFHLPMFEAFFEKGQGKLHFSTIVVPSVLFGILCAVLIFAIDFIFTLSGAAISTAQNLAPIWQKLLAAFYGGITEEILLRLFLMNLLIWIGMKLTKVKKTNRSIIVASISIAAIIFGIGHLPLTAALTKLTPLIIGRAIVLNGIGGVIFGWLYWKKGLEAAMIAHFTTDIFLLTILPLLFSK